MEKITATIITYNEENRIEDCLKSLQGIADEIIIVDSFSTDSTVEICRRYGCKITKRKFNGFGAQKQYAVSLSNYSYVMSIDADEILSDTLRQSILKMKEAGFKHRVYCMHRLNHYCNHPIRHCGWHPDRPTRLFDKRYATWNLRDINETVIFPPTLMPRPIEGKLLHYRCSSHEELLRKQERFAAINAHILISEGSRPCFLSPRLHALSSFLHTYLLKLGIADGKPGFEISVISAKYAYLTHYIARRDYKKERGE